MNKELARFLKCREENVKYTINDNTKGDFIEISRYVLTESGIDEKNVIDVINTGLITDLGLESMFKKHCQKDIVKFINMVFPNKFSEWHLIKFYTNRRYTRKTIESAVRWYVFEHLKIEDINEERHKITLKNMINDGFGPILAKYGMSIQKLLADVFGNENMLETPKKIYGNKKPSPRRTVPNSYMDSEILYCDFREKLNPQVVGYINKKVRIQVIRELINVCNKIENGGVYSIYDEERLKLINRTVAIAYINKLDIETMLILVMYHEYGKMDTDRKKYYEGSASEFRRNANLNFYLSETQKKNIEKAMGSFTHNISRIPTNPYARLLHDFKKVYDIRLAIDSAIKLGYMKKLTGNNHFKFVCCRLNKEFNNPLYKDFFYEHSRRFVGKDVEAVLEIATSPSKLKAIYDDMIDNDKVV